MPELSRAQKFRDLIQKLEKSQTRMTLRTFKPTRDSDTTRTPVNKPKDHISYTRMNKLGQGLTSINKTKNKRFR